MDKDAYKPSPHMKALRGAAFFAALGWIGYSIVNYDPSYSNEHGLQLAGMSSPDLYPEQATLAVVDERIERLNIPASILSENGPGLTVGDIDRLAAELHRHDVWIQQVIDEYKWSMTTDSDAEQKYHTLLKAQAELKETLASIDEHRTTLLEIAELEAQTTAAVQTTDAEHELKTERDTRRALISQQGRDFVSRRIDSLIEELRIKHLRDVRGNLTEIYSAAHAISLLEERSLVFAGGVVKPIDSVYGIDFTGSDETKLPRRTARSVYEFFQDNPGMRMVVTEGHTGDPSRPVSYNIEARSAGHKYGYAFDVDFLYAETPKDVYTVLRNSEGDPRYVVEYHVKTAAECERVRAGVIKAALEDNKTLAEAQQLAGQVKNYGWVTGGHMHVVSTGKLGQPLDPNGPSILLAKK